MVGGENDGGGLPVLDASLPMAHNGTKRGLSKVARKLEYCAIYNIATSPDGPTKIGYTINPKERLCGLNIACPDEVFCFALYWFLGPPLASKAEAECHYRLADKSRRGEWFNITTQEASQVVAEVADDLGLVWFDEETRLKLLYKANKFGPIHRNNLDKVLYDKKITANMHLPSKALGEYTRSKSVETYN